MKSKTHPRLGRDSTDSGLICDVQTHAGAHCHESASLMFSYHLYAELYRTAMGESGRGLALIDLERSEVALRKFLWKCWH